MHRLFWKLFVAVWLTLLLFTGGVVVATSLYLDHARAGASPDESGLLATFAQRMHEAQAAAARGGQFALAEWARAIDRDELVPLLVVDRNGRDVLQREVSPRAQGALQRRIEAYERGMAAARPPIRLPDGRELWLIPDFQGATLTRLVSRPHIVALQLVMATLVGALAALALARYLTRPIERLQRATQAWGDGDLAVRVGGGFGRRRDEIVDLARAMDTMAGRIEALLKAQGTLLRDVSHELRSPLARVQASLGLARKAGTDDPHLDRIEKDTERLNELIGNILRFSRLDTGIREAQREPVDLGSLLQDLADDARVEATTRSVAIGLSLPATAAGYAGDPLLLGSAVDNVLRNALRYTAPGSTVALALAPAGDAWRIVVDDAGPGVPAQMLERIFDPFVRVDDARCSTAGGVGLGLAIARKAVEAHGGGIHAENRAGGGLRVVLHLPPVGRTRDV